MRAVNLIPVEERRGSTRGASSLPTYGVIGVLALLLIGVTAWVVLSNQIGDRKAELAREQRLSHETQVRADRLKPYSDFAALEQKRVQTVRQLADSRFDWETTMHDLARVVGTNVWLTSFTGTVAPGVSVDGADGGGGTSNLRSALPNPAIQLSGCATSQSEVARFLSRLRAVSGVTRVTLAEASKSDTATSSGGGAPTTGGGGATGGDCRQGSARFPLFSLVIFFKPLPGGSPALASGSGGAATSTPSSTSGSSQPASPSSTSTGGSK